MFTVILEETHRAHHSTVSGEVTISAAQVLPPLSLLLFHLESRNNGCWTLVLLFDIVTQCTTQLFGMTISIQENKCMIKKEVWMVWWCGSHCVTLSHDVSGHRAHVASLPSLHSIPTCVLADLLIYRPSVYSNYFTLLKVPDNNGVLPSTEHTAQTHTIPYMPFTFVDTKASK